MLRRRTSVWARACGALAFGWVLSSAGMAGAEEAPSVARPDPPGLPGETAGEASGDATPARPWNGPALGPRTFATADLYGIYNPQGIVASASLVRRWVYALDGEEGGERTEWSWAQAGVLAQVNPAYSQAGILVDWTPQAWIQLHFEYDALFFHGARGALRVVDDPGQAFDVDRHPGLPGRDVAGVGHRVVLQPILSARYRFVIVRSQTSFQLYSFPNAGRYFYEYRNDTLMRGTDLAILEQAQLLFQAWKAPRAASVTVGAQYDVTWTAGLSMMRQRVAAVATVVPVDPWGPFDRARFYLVIGYVLQDRNRQGEPFALLGLGSDFDL